ncbi:lipopolysaccharide biosynthesis protein [Neorhodopirellula lusitana]|uniref:lipopolysaccharide biosynthesis protein n=1 Tax=Neorhodopirellula lusitana TaxID=445327 RepID=UPI00384FF455
MNTKLQSELNAQPRVAVILVIITFIGVGLGYASTIIAARILGPIGFKQYAVAIATLGVLSSLAEMGVGKNALKVLPGFQVSDQMSFASGYWRYSLATAFIASMTIAVLVVAWNLLFRDVEAATPVAVAMAFLPFAALCGVGIDLVMANRLAIGGALIARLIVPGTTLLLLTGVSVYGINVSISVMVILYGAGCVLGALLALGVFWRSSPSEYFAAAPSYRTKAWLRQSIYFAIFALLASALFRVSVLALETLPIDAIEVALMAAALDTGCLILLLAKSTDKLFQPQMSIVIAESDWETGLKIRTKRRCIIGGACALFLLVIWLFGKRILGLYGEEFQAAYPALCFVAVGASAWTFFSLSPMFLHYRGKSVFVLVVTALANVAMIAATVWYGTTNGATGAGLVFCVALVTTILLFRSRALSEFDLLEREGVRAQRGITLESAATD